MTLCQVWWQILVIPGLWRQKGHKFKTSLPNTVNSLRRNKEGVCDDISPSAALELIALLPTSYGPPSFRPEWRNNLPLLKQRLWHRAGTPKSFVSGILLTTCPKTAHTLRGKGGGNQWQRPTFYQGILKASWFKLLGENFCSFSVCVYV